MYLFGSDLVRIRTSVKPVDGRLGAENRNCYSYCGVRVFVVCVCLLARPKRAEDRKHEQLTFTHGYKNTGLLQKSRGSLYIGRCVGIIMRIFVVSDCCEGVYYSTSVLVPCLSVFVGADRAGTRDPLHGYGMQVRCGVEPSTPTVTILKIVPRFRWF